MTTTTAQPAAPLAGATRRSRLQGPPLQLLLLPNWVGGGAGLAGAAILYGVRIQREEKMMLENFGDEYRLYMRQTKRLVPWIV